MTLKVPYFDLKTPHGVISAVTNGATPKAPDGIALDPRVDRVMHVCWDADPTKRASICQVGQMLDIEENYDLPRMSSRHVDRVSGQPTPATQISFLFAQFPYFLDNRNGRDPVEDTVWPGCEQTLEFVHSIQSSVGCSGKVVWQSANRTRTFKPVV